MPGAADGAPPAQSRPVTEVASILLPALAHGPIVSIARTLAEHEGDASKAEQHSVHLEAMAGRMLAPGGWIAGHRRSSAEAWWTGRERPYDESTLRKAARRMVAAGAVPLAEGVLLEQVRGHVGARKVVAFTDFYDQVYWTKKDAWAGPVGGLGNRILACTYFGVTFVRAGEEGPVLALHASWHKPASPLIDALQALHAEERRARWLRGHVSAHVLDRGTQGAPTLLWCMAHGVPYVTLARGDADWRRFRSPTDHTAQGVPIFVRDDRALRDGERVEPARAPTVVIFPAHPERGEDDGRALRYRLATTVSPSTLRTLDTFYKDRWPANENPIKALVAVGFDRNLDRTLDPTTSRGHDGRLARLREREASARSDEGEAAATFLRDPRSATERRYLSSARARVKATQKVAALAKGAATKGARSARGAELLWKLLTLMIFNALAWLLSTSPLEAVRTLTPARVRALVLGCSATACLGPGTITLWIEATPATRDRPLQVELLRLINERRFKTPRGVLRIRLRDPPSG